VSEKIKLDPRLSEPRIEQSTRALKRSSRAMENHPVHSFWLTHVVLGDQVQLESLLFHRQQKCLISFYFPLLFSHHGGDATRQERYGRSIKESQSRFAIHRSKIPRPQSSRIYFYRPVGLVGHHPPPGWSQSGPQTAELRRAVQRRTALLKIGRQILKQRN